jgi:hypothetical protein
VTSTTASDANTTPIPPTSHFLHIHTLAHEIITRRELTTHENARLSPSEQSILALSVAPPSTKDDILRQHDMFDAGGRENGNKGEY